MPTDNEIPKRVMFDIAKEREEIKAAVAKHNSEDTKTIAYQHTTLFLSDPNGNMKEILPPVDLDENGKISDAVRDELIAKVIAPWSAKDFNDDDKITHDELPTPRLFDAKMAKIFIEDVKKMPRATPEKIADFTKKANKAAEDGRLSPAETRTINDYYIEMGGVIKKPTEIPATNSPTITLSPSKAEKEL